MKRGVSPVVATVLLIAITVVLAAIIFLWARSFLAEGAQKQGRAVELSCENLIFEASLVREDVNGEVETKLQVVNQGDVAIYGFTYKSYDEGSVTPYDLEDSGITAGNSKSFLLYSTDTSTTEAALPVETTSGLVVPILLGEEDSGSRVTFPCSDSSGKEVSLE